MILCKIYCYIIRVDKIQGKFNQMVHKLRINEINVFFEDKTDHELSVTGHNLGYNIYTKYLNSFYHSMLNILRIKSLYKEATSIHSVYK